MHLFILRHGEYLPRDPSGQNPLSAQGKRDIEALANYMKEKKWHLQWIYHSQKLRARQSAEIIKNVACPMAENVEKDYLNPHDSVESVVNDLEDLAEDTMIVGHLPFLGDLVSQLVMDSKEQSPVKFMPGTLVILKSEDNIKWSIVSIHHPGAV